MKILLNVSDAILYSSKTPYETVVCSRSSNPIPSLSTRCRGEYDSSNLQGDDVGTTYGLTQYVEVTSLNFTLQRTCRHKDTKENCASHRRAVFYPRVGQGLEPPPEEAHLRDQRLGR